LVFPLVLINMVPSSVNFLTVLVASILTTCAAQHYMCCPTLHVLPNITCAAQHYMCCPTLHVLPNISCAAQHYMCCPTLHVLPNVIFVIL
jgi:hypothetical protein